MKKVAILGAGLSGLTLAYFLQKKFGTEIEIFLIEKSMRCGGYIQTIQKEGFLFELGPHSIRTTGNGSHTLELIEELGLQNDVILPNANKRYILFNNRLKKLPHNLFSILFSPTLMKAILKDLSTSTSYEDESVYDFAFRRFGKKVADLFIDPLVLGIYAGNAKELSIKACFPLWKKWEQEHGSVLKGLFKQKKKVHESSFVRSLQSYPMISFKHGMETLTKRLESTFKGKIYFSTEVIKIDHSVLTLSNQEQLEVDHFFNTVSLYPIKSSLAVVNLGYHNCQLPQKGFGYLIPTQENKPSLGVIWDSIVFPDQNHHPKDLRLTVMIREVKGWSDKDYLKEALERVSLDLHLKKAPDLFHVKLLREAIPQHEGISINDIILKSKTLSIATTDHRIL